MYLAVLMSTRLLMRKETMFNDAFVSNHNPVTGGYKRAAPKVTARIILLTRQRMGSFWIGKTSGAIDGCRARWGKYKNMKIRMNKMSIVYASKNQHYALKMEKIQIERFRQVINNKTRGGGGRYAATHKMPFVVYIAWRE